MNLNKQRTLGSLSVRSRAAFTLTEIAIVLALIGIIIGAIWVAAGSVFTANKANQAVQDITTIATNIRQTYLAANSFSVAGDQTANLLAAGGIFPADLLVGNPATSVQDQWNGAVKVTFNPSGNNRVFRVSFLATPADACVRIASQLARMGTSDAPINLITNSATVTAIPNTGANVGLSMGTIQTECALNTGTATDSTEFDFTIH